MKRRDGWVDRKMSIRVLFSRKHGWEGNKKRTGQRKRQTLTKDGSLKYRELAARASVNLQTTEPHREREDLHTRRAARDRNIYGKGERE